MGGSAWFKVQSSKFKVGVVALEPGTLNPELVGDAVASEAGCPVRRLGRSGQDMSGWLDNLPDRKSGNIIAAARWLCFVRAPTRARVVRLEL